MATIFKLTITLGKGESAHTREISIDPEEVPMGVLEDLDGLKDSHDWKKIRPIITGLFDLTDDEFRQMTAGQFVQIAGALTGAVTEATAIPNAI